jgi:hypothetical protein
VRVRPQNVASSGVPVCDAGCLDDVVDVTEVVLAKAAAEFAAAGSLPPFSWFCRTAATTDSDLSRADRVSRQLPSRFDRLPATGWMQAALPDERDRALLAHLLAWVASDGPAVPGTVWPAESWLTTYGHASAADLLSEIDRVVGVFASACPDKHHRWIAVPLAAKVASTPPAFVSLEVSLERDGVDSFGAAA